MTEFFVDVQSTVCVVCRMKVEALDQKQAERLAIELFGREFSGDCDSSVDTTIETTSTILLRE